MVKAEQGSLRRFLRGLCGGDSFRADDIAQEALLKAYLSFERFEGRARFSTWLFRIAYNCWYDHVHKTEYMGSTSLDEGKESAGKNPYTIADDTSEADRFFEHQQLYEAIGSLSRLEQAVVLLFYMEDKTIKEIQTITGMPSGTIRSHLSRGRRHLKEYLLQKGI